MIQPNFLTIQNIDFRQSPYKAHNKLKNQSWNGLNLTLVYLHRAYTPV